METREWNRSRGPWLARFVVGALLALLVVGLWQGYGAWWFGARANAG